MSSTPTEMNRDLQGDDVVKTHVWHVVDEDHTDGRLSTVCGYHLTGNQYETRMRWKDAPVTVTHICHHCARTLREDDR